MDLARIKENVAKMASMSAPEADIDGYIASEGATLDQVRDFQPHESSPEVSPAAPSTPDTVTDVAKSVSGSAIPRGVAGAVMTLPNLLNSAAEGPQLLYRGIRDTFTGAPTDRSPTWKPFLSSEEVLQSLPVKPYDPQTPAGRAADFVGQIAVGAGTAKQFQNAAQRSAPPVQRPAPTQTAAKEQLAADAETLATPKSIWGNESSGKARIAQPKTADEIKALSQEAYAKAEATGGVLKPTVTDGFLNEVQSLAPTAFRILAVRKS